MILATTINLCRGEEKAGAVLEAATGLKLSGVALLAVRELLLKRLFVLGWIVIKLLYTDRVTVEEMGSRARRHLVTFALVTVIIDGWERRN